MRWEKVACFPTYSFPDCWQDGLLFPNERMPLILYHPQAALCYPDIKKQTGAFLPYFLEGQDVTGLDRWGKWFHL